MTTPNYTPIARIDSTFFLRTAFILYVFAVNKFDNSYQYCYVMETAKKVGLLVRRPPIKWLHLPALGDDVDSRKMTKKFFVTSHFFNSHFLLFLSSSIDVHYTGCQKPKAHFFILKMCSRNSMHLHVFISNIGAKFQTTLRGRTSKKLSIADTNYRGDFIVVAAISVDPNSTADIPKDSSYSHYVLPLF